ncbi:MAG TPA: hypothetical protein VF073_09530 [Gaiella sp.]
MDPRALELLELPEILDRLAAAAASDAGKQRCLALEPAARPDEVDRRQGLTHEAIGLIEQSAEPELADVRDVRHAAEVAARGSALDPAALRSVALAIDTAIAARATIEATGAAPGLAELAGLVDTTLSHVSEPITRAVEHDGSDLRDDASPALRRLRRELREGRGRITERLRSLARDPALREHLSEDFVTERAGRPVLALRASARGTVPASSTTARARGRRCSSSRSPSSRTPTACARRRAASGKRSRGSCATSHGGSASGPTR